MGAAVQEEASTRNKEGTHNYVKVPQSKFCCPGCALAAEKFWRRHWSEPCHKYITGHRFQFKSTFLHFAFSMTTARCFCYQWADTVSRQTNYHMCDTASFSYYWSLLYSIYSVFASNIIHHWFCSLHCYIYSHYSMCYPGVQHWQLMCACDC